MHQIVEHPAEMAALDEVACWQAVQTRARNADGQFVYAVASTGIYCRPSCPARRPRRDRVRFFDTPAAADSAGYRPCRRCRPDSTGQGPTRVQQACRLLEGSSDSDLPLDALGRQLDSSPEHLQRSFKQATGVTPRQYTSASRLNRFKAGVRAGATVTTALNDAGYGSTRGLYEKAAEHLGMTPATYRRGGQGVAIRFTVVPCSLGHVLVAATDKGICAVSLGDAPDELETWLRQEFHAAQIQRDDERLAPWAQALTAYTEGRPLLAELPLDVQATAFQAAVWQVLRDIPRGETRTYTQVAEAIGQPTAVRAVARACATNAVSLLIPCHRVVRSDGSLSGYRWGVERKRKLLKREAEK